MPPPLHRFFVLFACPLFRLLAGPAQLVEESAYVVGVVVDVKRLGDHLGHPTAGPQLGRISGLPWPSRENSDELLLLLRVQAGLAAGMWLG